MKTRSFLLALGLAVLCSCSPKIVNLPSATFDQKVFQEQYKLNKAEWDAAFAFLSRPDLGDLKLGEWHQLTPNTRGRVQDVKTRKEGKWEAHKRVVDVFYVVEGVDKVGVSRLEDMRDCVRPYDDKKDVVLYQSSAKPRYVVLKKGQGIFLFPTDAHCPNLCVDEPAGLHVAVVKIPFIEK